MLQNSGALAWDWMTSVICWGDWSVGVLYQEELVGTQGFAGVSSLVYHLYPPTIVKEKGTPYSVEPEITIDKNLSALSFKGLEMPDADEMIFVHKGHGWVETMYGQIPFEYGDYIVIPRGTIYKIHFLSKQNRLLYIESFSPIGIPSRYRNQSGQMLEHAPFCERDFKLPKDLETHDQHGQFSR